MNDPVAAVKPNGQNDDGDLHPTKAGGSRGSGGPGARFTYPSGSRPLEGYTIKRGLGHGGFGEVYYATSDAGKEVALKLLRRNLDIELRGIRHCLNLKHPDLVAIYDIREDDRGDKWVVMEYVNGQSLEDLIAAHPQGVPQEEVLAWIHGIGAGVACLHDHGIVHRDLKPGNIFSDEGLVKIGDYGLSKFISCSRRSGQTESVGTVHYMAPEVANGRYGKEIDVYALGVILFEMLTGRVPFEGESVGEVLMKHLTATADVSMLSEPYRSVVSRALEKDPAKRFRSVPEMLAGLPQPSGGQVHGGPIPSVHPKAAEAFAGNGPTPPVPPIPVAQSADEEPILRAVRQGVGRMHENWNRSNFNTPTKVILLLVGVYVFMHVAPALIALAFPLLILYACYWVVRSIVLAGPPDQEPQTARPPDPPTPSSAAAAAAEQAAVDAGRHGRPRHVAHRRMPRWARRERPADALVLKPRRQRVAELLGSLLGSVLAATAMCTVMMMLSSVRADMLRPEQFAWLLLVTIAGAWAILVPSKFWEGSRGEVVLRRLVMMAAGLAVGAVAFGLALLLRVELPYHALGDPLHHYQFPPRFYRDGTPLLFAHMACFGTLFLAIRWWRLADPLRRTRLGLKSIFFCVLMAWLVAGLWQYPRGWLMMVACAMTASVQLSSPWLNPRQRHRQPNGR